MKKIVDATLKDITTLLSKERLSAFDFNRVADISKIAASLCNAHGQPSERAYFAQALEDSEYKAPLLHEELKERLFRGEGVLKEKYRELSAYHSDLRHQAINIAEAQGAVANQQKALKLREEILDTQASNLERERERLMLAAPGVVSIPALPGMALGEDEGDEDVGGV